MAISPRRLAGILAALAAVLICVSFNAGPAYAENPCNSPDPPPTCGGGSTTTTEYKDVSLTVQIPAGHVTSSPTGVDCTSTCAKTFTVSRKCTDGDCGAWTTKSLTLSADGGPGGTFPSWTGCSNDATTCDVSFSDNKTVSLTWKDTWGPTISFAPPAKAGHGTTITATATDNVAVKSMYWVVDNRAQPIVDGPVLTLSLDELTEGDHMIAVGAYDTSGNANQTVARLVTVDKSVHLTLGQLPAYTNADTVPLTFTTDEDVPAEGRRCGLNDGLTEQCPSPDSYSPIDASSPDGTYTYHVTVIDEVGNTASDTRAVVLDRTLPVVAFTGGPAEGQVLTTPSATVPFTATDANLHAVTCKVDAGAFAPCASALALTGLTAGAHTVTVRAVDKAGNVREVKRVFSYKAPTTKPGETPGGETPGGDKPGGGEQPGGAPKPALVVKGRAAKGVTTIKAFLLKRLPKGAKVTIACKGKGCAKKKLVLKSPTGGVLRVKALVGRKLRAGVKLTVKVTAPGRPAYSRTVAIRAGKAPLVRA